MKIGELHPALGGLLTAVLVMGLLLVTAVVVTSCSATTVTPDVVGDRAVTRISTGTIITPNGDKRFYLVLRDPDTNTDYLAVQDAGIIELKPKPMKVEK
jgi:hypothetical protein